jgi:hypothetical protein
VNVLEAVPVALVAVIVNAVAAAEEVGVPESKPVEVLKVRPAGADGEIEYEAMVPPVDAIVYPEIGLLTVFVSEVEEIVNAGTARTGAEVLTTTGAALVLIEGVASEAADMPSTLTAAIVNVYVLSDDKPETLT